MPRWSVDIIRKRAEHLGIVEAKESMRLFKLELTVSSGVYRVRNARPLCARTVDA
jgi:hypothetical protein